MLAFTLTLSVLTCILTQKCAKFECSDRSDKTCTTVQAGFGSKGYNNVTFYDVCSKVEKCNIDSFESLTQSEADATYNCTTKNSSMLTRYPGEDCNVNTDCLKSDSSTGSCINNKCSGRTNDEPCNSNEACLVSLYCSSSGKCTPQKKKGEDCVNTYECPNSLLCYHETCSIKPFSLPLGSFIPYNDRDIMEQYCVLGTAEPAYCLSSDVGCGVSCTAFNQTFTDEYRECEYGDDCEYSYNGKFKSILKCSCGLNGGRKGYCQQGQNMSKRLILIFRRTGVA
jgi:hypothetical protein